MIPEHEQIKGWPDAQHTYEASGDKPFSPSNGYAAEQRESRKWWARVDKQVKEVTGWDCKPHNPRTWWCPEVGYSLNEGYQLFETEYEALDREILETAKSLVREQNRLDALRARRAA